MSTAIACNTDTLRETLARIDHSNSESWVSDLEPRKVEESEFHDEKVDRLGMPRTSEMLPQLHQANQKYYSVVTNSRQYLHDWIRRHAPGKVMLDYACGQGASARFAAQAGAKLAIGLDISRGSILNARADAEEDGLTENTFFLQGDCENTGLPDSCIDVMLCSGMLHHLDVELAFPEMYRILKPGGVCLAMEALDYNPLIKLYRLLTPGLRTEWEKHHILSHRDVKIAKQYFSVRDVRYWHLFSIMAAPLRRTPLFEPALRAAHAIDHFVLRVPPVSYLAWQFTFELHKPTDETLPS